MTRVVRFGAVSSSGLVTHSTRKISSRRWIASGRWIGLVRVCTVGPRMESDRAGVVPVGNQHHTQFTLWYPSRAAPATPPQLDNRLTIGDFSDLAVSLLC